MQAYRVETMVTESNTLILKSLPFRVGEMVEVIILAKETTMPIPNLYPLRGLPVFYADPTEPVAQNDWEILQ